MIRRHSILALRCLAAGAAIALLAGAGTAGAADFTPNASTKAAPSTRPAAGPESAAAGARPVSGKNPSAGPQFSKSGSTWQVIAPETVLRNTVTDADGDRSNLSFEAWTTDASGKPKTQVKLTDANPHGVLVSPFVASGQTAQVTVDYGKLKPGVLYTFRTSAFDGSLYETSWSPWANFKINPYATFPAPQASSTIDPMAQSVREVTRSDPGPVTAARKAKPKRTCSPADAQGRTLCIEVSPPSKQAKRTPPSSAPAVELVDWCVTKPHGKDYITRSEACLKSVGQATLIFLDTDPTSPALGTATFDIEQSIKTYPNKGSSGSNFAEFDQQLILTPRHIDAALQGVTLKWNVGMACSSCVTSQTKWVDSLNKPSDAHWAYANDGRPYESSWGTVQTTWSGTGKETIDLGWSITATVDASSAATATADFGTSGKAPVRELAPRCDDILKGAAPGCALPFYRPVYTIDTNLYPAAGAYYWLMQEKMPGHPGSLKWDSFLRYLGPDTTVKHPVTGAPWTSNDSRGKVCPSSWTAHPSDADLGALSCDEYAMASTHESGGFPGGPNQVASGNECAQLYADRLGDGSSNFGLLADVRAAKGGPSWKEKCGRAAVPAKQNSEAFKNLNPATLRLLDSDGFFVSNPGFEHCANANTTCAWRKVG
ncbi:hypothetical protein [Streptomyces jumonjinensis]|uniref:Uncharacterized protein n=1 Tax=Streptomyces jumonjinensis TaxID=1945 RepID=A0A646KKG3_STRJU|nr:hypothetical protein [Streptomyces jumonjinensis]MQT02772.1 hypothetical protein [Streptomyces jumonjinensis]